MLDLQFICEHQEEVEQNCRNRGVLADVAKIIELAKRRSQTIIEGDRLRHEQKEISALIPKADATQRPSLIDRGKSLRQQVADNETSLKILEGDLRLLQVQVPNMTHPEAPVGAGDNANRVVKTWGDVPKFSFKPLDHVALMEGLNLVDLEAGARVAGHGFYFLKNEAVFLEMALVQLALEKLRAEGFTVFTTPDLARDDVLHGIGFLPRGPEAQIYSIENSDLSLVATAEITLGGSQKDQVLDSAALPLKLAGLSHCFRTEAGAHGRATRGIYRVHQFTKVEMFGFTAPDLATSNDFLAMVVGIEESLFQSLGIPYRIIDTCTGDLGGPAYRKFDLEAWMPGRGDAGEFGEVTSASNCTDYQARRLGIRCKGEDRKGTHFVHTLNGTAVAATRAIIAILENYQQADGSVIVPEVLRKWVGRDRIGPK
jgi:seryl-tRNA synthetase